MYIPIFFPKVGTPALFNDRSKNIYRVSFDSWYTERKIDNDGLKFQVDIGSAQHVNSTKFFIAAHQLVNRNDLPEKDHTIAFFDNLDVRNLFCEIDGQI